MIPRAHSTTPTAAVRLQWGILLAGTLAALIAACGLATQSLVVGSPEGRWVYRYAGALTLNALLAAGGVSLLAVWLLPITERWQSRREWPVVLLWILVACGCHALLRCLTPFTLEQIFASNGANAFDGVARRYYAGTVLSDFERVRSYWPTHAQSNMPGKLMLVYALRQISKRPDVLPWLVVLVSNLGGALMYLFVRHLFEDRRVALYSLVLYLFVPARLFFFPLLNTVTPIVLLACACILLAWLQTGRAIWAGVLGVTLYGLVFFEPLPLVMGILFAALAARAIHKGTLTLTRFLLQCGVVATGFLAAHLTMRFSFGFDLLRAFQQIAAHALEFNAVEDRPYSIWIWHNLREFALGAGVCQFALVSAALVAGLGGSGTLRERLSQPIAVVSLSVAAVLLITDAIGMNRGEVIRLWIFLACFVQIPAAWVCARLHHPAAIALLLVTSILVGTLGTSMVGFIVPE